MITKIDIVRTADSIGKTLEEHEIQKIIELYPEWEKQDPTATWNLIIEDLIYFIISERNEKQKFNVDDNFADFCIKKNREIVLEELSDEQLLHIVDELQKSEWEEDSIIRKLSAQFYGKSDLLCIAMLPHKILPEVAKRMKCYSPHIDKK
jgi:hypothetical protein